MFLRELLVDIYDTNENCHALLASVWDHHTEESIFHQHLSPITKHRHCTHTETTSSPYSTSLSGQFVSHIKLLIDNSLTAKFFNQWSNWQYFKSWTLHWDCLQECIYTSELRSDLPNTICGSSTSAEVDVWRGTWWYDASDFDQMRNFSRCV